MPETLSCKFLTGLKWNNIRIGSHIVSFCETCGCQRLKYCVSKEWDADDKDWLFVFLCGECEDIPMEILMIPEKKLEWHLDPDFPHRPIGRILHLKRKRKLLDSLENTAMQINFDLPDENVVVDKENGCIVWKSKKKDGD